MLLSIHQRNFREHLALKVQLDPWQCNFGSAIGQVLQSLTLQVKEGALYCQMDSDPAAHCCMNSGLLQVHQHEAQLAGITGSGGIAQPCLIDIRQHL